jgi:DNA-binding transcriptional LysR family regulator
MQMQQLEAEIGLPLFERSGRGLTLTAAGQEVLVAAERVEAVLADCIAGVAALRSLTNGRVTVGVVSTAKYFAPQMLAAFARIHPGIDIKLVVCNRADIITAFKDGRLDLGVMGRPPEDVAVESTLIGDHPQVLIAPPTHPLSRRRAILPHEITGESLLMREVGSGTRLMAERFLARHAIKPHIGMEIGSNETIKQAVIAGLGIAFISAHTIAAEINDGRLVVLDLVGLPEIRQWFTVRVADRRMMPASGALWDFLVAKGHRFLPTLKDFRRVRPSAQARFRRAASKRKAAR